jgi:uroporphyrinogen-III synthase
VIRVAITTDRYEMAASTYARLGLEPVAVPCIRVDPASGDVLAATREAAAGADVLLISSVRTLDLLWPKGPMPRVDVAAVGQMTAAAVEARRGRVAVTGRSGLGALIRDAADLLVGSQVVFPHAAGSDLSLLHALRAQAGALIEFEVYRAVPVAPIQTPVAAVAFASPSAVAGWLLSRDLERLVVGVIGPTTRAAVARLRPPDVVASQPSHVALARAMASYLEVSV